MSDSGWRSRSRRQRCNPEEIPICLKHPAPSRSGFMFALVHPGLRMRCYFHLVNGHDIIPDNVGVEVADLETAQRQALKAIQEIREEVGQAEEDWQSWRLNVVCPLGSVLLSIRLDTPLQ
jgi:hypothetical protein